MPSSTFDLDALASRVMGLTIPARARRRRGNRSDRILAVALVVSTAVATAISIELAIQSHFWAALRLFVGCIACNIVILHLRAAWCLSRNLP
jgi:hypothetical protein